MEFACADGEGIHRAELAREGIEHVHGIERFKFVRDGDVDAEKAAGGELAEGLRDAAYGDLHADVLGGNAALLQGGIVHLRTA